MNREPHLTYLRKQAPKKRTENREIGDVNGSIVNGKWDEQNKERENPDDQTRYQLEKKTKEKGDGDNWKGSAMSSFPTRNLS